MSKETLGILFKQIREWQHSHEKISKVGAQASANHLVREAGELYHALGRAEAQDGGEDHALANKLQAQALEEHTDAFFLWVQAGQRWSYEQICASIVAKLRVNQEDRTWQDPDAEGVVEHVREEETEA